MFFQRRNDAKLLLDGKTLVVASYKTLYFFDLATRTVLQSFDLKEEIIHLACATDGLTLGILTKENLIILDLD
jgi:hypothetical protein